MDRNTVLLAVYIFVFTMVCIYGLHRYQLVYLYYKHRRNTPRIQRRFQRLPRVTVQLPMYNERYVARRVIELACGIEYPRDRLQIQVLDDSTDDTVEVARQAVEDMRRLGHDIVYIHRDNRHGYKAGALQEGLETATGEFVCIFDADFLPPPGILHKTIHHFTDDRVGMVQARWEHINRDYSLLTKTQAVLLDGHFVMEHGARNRSGRFMSFNGTAGIWRISCISDAGGWQHDTLTEDLDLSYRAQLKGWEFLFLPDLCSPAELPPEMEAFKAQQYRWAKGGAQTCRKVLPRILRSPVPLKVKWEAFFHLTSCTVYLYMVLLTVLLFPVLYMGVGIPQHRTVWGALLDASLFLIATCSASSFYACSQRELARVKQCSGGTVGLLRPGQRVRAHAEIWSRPQHRLALEALPGLSQEAPAALAALHRAGHGNLPAGLRGALHRVALDLHRPPFPDAVLRRVLLCRPLVTLGRLAAPDGRGG
jgi:cellulose synthase/poly-beta-1,6-N-acetylglucosamine synthase-like glycosyltransferase